MPLVDKHTPGDFCWIELATSDQNGAKRFYSSLFGWEANDMPMGPDAFYTIFRLQGKDCAAGYTIGVHEQGMPPHWNLYISVENADAAANQAASLGAKVIAAAFDVMDAGRMAVLEDPTGAVFIVWQPNRNAGIGIVNEPGAFCWADLSTPDPARAQKFYEALFGWEIAPGEGKGANDYLHIKNAGRFIGGIQPSHMRNPHAPPHWLIYLNVAGVDASAAKAKQLGARFYVDPMNIEDVGRLAIMADPQGAVSAIFKESPSH
ncbi:MAG TPA: VOC family protein [Bryobacteraceae bacterium]|nr:VOC family protein [Bryobacteraceae bacterium]